MKRLKLTNFEANTIQVGLDHIKDEFLFLSDLQYKFSHKIVIGLTSYINNKDSKEFKVNNFNIVLISMAVTEIYLMHTDILHSEKNDTDDFKFSKEVLKTCESVFNKLMKLN